MAARPGAVQGEDFRQRLPVLPAAPRSLAPRSSPRAAEGRGRVPGLGSQGWRLAHAPQRAQPGHMKGPCAPPARRLQPSPHCAALASMLVETRPWQWAFLPPEA